MHPSSHRFSILDLLIRAAASLGQVVICAVAIVPGAVTLAQEAPDLRGAVEKGFAALDRGDAAGAIAAADAIVKDHKDEPAAWRSAGDIYLRAGEAKRSLPLFRRYIERYPDREPDLWQYGIALAFAGEYEAGRKLFELHRTVNPNDVENALWHFYCVAKASSPEAASRLILPAPGDRRVPMDLLLKMYRGEADEAAVRKEVDALPAGSAQSEMANFYAELYLAMYHDAMGARTEALKHAAKAATAKEVNYMTDIGRVYDRLLRKAAP